MISAQMKNKLTLLNIIFLEKDKQVSKINEILYNKMIDIERNLSKLSPEFLQSEYRDSHVSSQAI